MKKITVFTDGASRGNPGPGGWGAIIIFDKKNVKEIGGAQNNTTNNRMEMTAALSALQEIGEAEIVDLYTDSSYLINGITKWVQGWQANGWQTAKKENVLNTDLWKKLLIKTDKFKGKLNWHHVRGHRGIEANERADEIATAFADNKKIKLYDGPYSSYDVDVFDVVSKKENDKKKARSRSNKKAYSYLSLVDGVLKKHKTWSECEKRVKGKSSAKFKKALSPDEEAKIIKEWGL